MDSHTPSLAEFEARLAKLERQNRRLKRLGLLFLLITGSGFLLAQAPRKPPSAAPAPATPAASYDTLVVHRLELRDKAGKLRGVWTVEDDVPGLTLYDTDGTPRAGLGVLADSPLLTLSDTAGKTRAMLSVAADGPALTLYDSARKTRAVLDVGAKGPRLWLYDAAEETRAGLIVLADGPMLALYDAAGKVRAWLAEDSLGLEDAQQFKAVLGVTRLQAVGTGESRTTSAAAVTLFGKDGKAIWRAP
jgi:hypothetical protein